MTAQLRGVLRGARRKVDERTAALKTALEQQTAISEILRVISASPTDVQPVMDAVAERAAILCDAPSAQVLLLADDGALHIMASRVRGDLPAIPSGYVVALDRGMITGRCVLDGRTVHHADVVPLLDTEFPAARENVLKFGFRAVLAVPLMREQKAYGTLFVWRPVPGHFSPDEVALLETFARQAAIAIDNVRLFNETREALEQQQASGEVLATISSSISDTTPVFERILESCARLFDGKVVGIPLLGEDGQMSLGAYRGPERPAMERHYPRPADETSGAGTAILRREIQHYPDIEAPGVPPSARTVFRVNGVARRALRADALEGRRDRRDLRRPDERGTVLRQGDRALRNVRKPVIAIQNARLFNRRARRSSRQTATAEVLQVISQLGRRHGRCSTRSSTAASTCSRPGSSASSSPTATAWSMRRRGAAQRSQRSSRASPSRSRRPSPGPC
jgi:GAF domain-containing protein